MIDDLDKRIAELSPAKRKLLEARLARASSPIPPGRAVRLAPASMAQRRLWLIDAMGRGGTAYNNAYGIRFHGPLDAALLKNSLSQIIQRHDTLRMRFDPPTAGDESGPMAVVEPELEGDLQLVDLGALGEADRQAEASRRAVELGRMPFDLAHGPLLRTTLLRLAPDEHLLVLVVHHIISDRWSVGVLLAELATIYSAGGAAALGPLTFSYSDYAAREHAQTNDLTMADHRDYWRTLLADLPPPLEIPSDHSRPAQGGYRGAVHALAIPSPLVSSLNQIARQRGATPFMLFLAAFEVLLHRYTAQEDLVIGTPLAGRNRVETEGLFGLFINMLPLRARVKPDAPFVQVLADVKSATLGLLAHQDMPFDHLVDQLQLARDPSRHPVFDIVFNFHNVPYAPAWPSGLRVELEEIDLGTSRFDLTLTLRPQTDGSLSCQFEYSGDLFEPATIERLAGHFQTLLAGIASNPECSIGQLPLLAKEERLRILRDWSGVSSLPPPPSWCAHEMIEQQAARTPDAVALVYGLERLTYAELNRRANRLAWHFRSLGVGPDQLVGICLRRTNALPVALLAILKAGGAYVPLDPAYPKQRLAHMLQDSQARVLVTERELAPLFEANPRRTTVFIDPAAPWFPDANAENPPPLSSLDNLAYVMYTSGSTGTPKGVAIEHRGPAAFVEWSRYALPDEQVAGMLFSTSICFDISVLELLVPLCRGGKLIVVQNVLEVPDCPAVVAGEVTFINTVPSAMTELVGIGGIPSSVRGVGVGGEAVPGMLVRRCYDLPGVQTVYNLYGPTEDTIYSTFFPVPRDHSGPASAPPIGRPFAGSRAYILDAHLEPTPCGVNGELYLGGVKLARGYLGRPDLTAQRFVPDPRGLPTDRLYRTGDLCHWNADGTIQYVGRIDHQIKLRGFRIELGEIEAALGSHPAIQRCVVILTGEESDRRLTAYWVAQEGAGAPSEDDLRRHLATTLPAHMIPTVWIRLPALPLMPNGKIDRKALPAPAAAASPQAQRTAAAKTFTSPATRVQQQLAKIWCEILHLSAVSIEANFFELGGHSLRLVRVAARVRQELKIEIPLHSFFDHPTIAGLAALIEGNVALAPEAPPIAPLRPDQPSPLSYGQQRLWFLDRFETNIAAYNVAYSQRLVGPLDVRKLEKSFAAVVRRHEALRTAFPEVEGVATQIILPPEQVRIEISCIDLARVSSRQRERDLRRHLADNGRQRFDLGTWPLFRIKLLQLGPTEHILALCLHHIICDDWSVRLLYGEIAQFYSGHTLSAPLTVQYRDYAHWQHQWLEAGELDQQMDYWLKQLAGAPNLLALRTDRPRGPRQGFRGARLPVALGPSLSRALQDLSRRHGATSFMTMLAAFNLLLSRWTGQRDILVGTPVANRDRAQTQNLIGFFLNTLALRTDLTGRFTFAELLDRVRRTALDAYANQHVPFERLIESLQVPRSLSHSPLVQVMLVLINQAPAVMELPGITSTPLPTDSGAAKFELTLLLNEAGDQINGWLEYNIDLFHETTIKKLIARFLGLLEEVVAAPDRTIDAEAALEPAAGQQSQAVLGPDFHGAEALVLAKHKLAPRNDTEREVLHIWQDVLGISDIGVEESFFDLGGHSLMAVRLMHRLKQRFGRSLPLARLFEAPTIAQLSRMLDDPSLTADDFSDRIVELRAGDSRPPLFCLPGAGGHAFTFRPLTELMDPRQPVYALHVTGLERCEQRLRTIEDMGAGCLTQIRHLQADGPYHLAGYSFGGILAFEMARQLVAAGQRVALLGVFDSSAPGQNRHRSIYRKLLVHGRRLLQLSPRDAIVYARTRLGNLTSSLGWSSSFAKRAGQSPSTEIEMQRAIQRIKEAVIRAKRLYQPEPYPGMITLFRANPESESDAFYDSRPMNGWETLALGGVDVHNLPGNHLTLFQPPNVVQLARELEACLRNSAVARRSHDESSPILVSGKGSNI